MTVIMGGMAAAPTTTPSTRERLIAAAIEVFAAQGYDGARVQDIARAAGLTTGAIYANYRGKADLLFDAIVALAGEEVEALLVHARGRDARELIEQLDADLTRRATATRPSLLLDAIVAARRDPELAAMLRRRIAAREAMFAELFARALQDGAITPQVDRATFARYCMHVAMGALVLRTLDLAPPDQPAWDALIHQLVGALAPTQEDNP